jgi:hypothetical protein
VKREYLLTSWDDHTRAEQDIGSDLYHTAEEVEDEGAVYRVTVEMERVQ